MGNQYKGGYIEDAIIREMDIIRKQQEAYRNQFYTSAQDDPHSTIIDGECVEISENPVMLKGTKNDAG